MFLRRPNSLSLPLFTIFILLIFWIKSLGDYPPSNVINTENDISIFRTKNDPCDVIEKTIFSNSRFSSKEIAERKSYYKNIVLNVDHSKLGASDAEDLIVYLAPLVMKYRETSKLKQFLIIDIGANVGKTSRQILSKITDFDCRQDYVYGHEQCLGQMDDVAVFAFEPMPKNYEELIRKGKDYNWQLGNWVGYQCAVGTKNGITSFFSTGSEGDEIASQDSNSASGLSSEFKVPIVTLDSFFYEDGYMRNDIPSYGTKEIIKDERIIRMHVFFLKIDAEGFDDDVLLGGKRLLREKRIKFLSFEYNSSWFSSGRVKGLKETLKYLYDLEYFCFWITPQNLIPVTGLWWEEEYEIKRWSNIFCGLRNDKDFHFVVDSYNSKIVP